MKPTIGDRADRTAGDRDTLYFTVAADLTLSTLLVNKLHSHAPAAAEYLKNS